MTVDAPTDTTHGQPCSREQSERQLIEQMHNDPMQIYAAYLSRFGTGDADAPTLTPLAMVRSLLELEFPRSCSA